MTAEKYEVDALTHLWRANLSIGRNRDGFYFRAPDDCTRACAIAQQLADQSEYINLKAAPIVSIERIARLFN
jgi:hypothetical protein